MEVPSSNSQLQNIHLEVEGSDQKYQKDFNEIFNSQSFTNSPTNSKHQKHKSSVDSMLNHSTNPNFLEDISVRAMVPQSRSPARKRHSSTVIVHFNFNFPNSKVSFVQGTFSQDYKKQTTHDSNDESNVSVSSEDLNQDSPKEIVEEESTPDYLGEAYRSLFLQHQQSSVRASHLSPSQIPSNFSSSVAACGFQLQ